MANDFIRELERAQPNLTSLGSSAATLFDGAIEEVRRTIRYHQGNVEKAVEYALKELQERDLISAQDKEDLLRIYADLYSLGRGRQNLGQSLDSTQAVHNRLLERGDVTPIARALADIGCSQLVNMKNEADQNPRDDEWVTRKASLGHQILATAAVGALIGSAWGGAGAVVGAFVAPLAAALVGACSGDDDQDE